MEKEKQAKMPDARITPVMIADMRAKSGLKLRTEGSIHNEEATRLAILKRPISTPNGGATLSAI